MGPATVKGRKTSAARAELLRQKREWYRKNRAAILEKQRAYREANKAAIAQRDSERKKRYRAAQPEKFKERGRAWSAANKEKVRAKTQRWMAANRDRKRQANREWKKRNADKVRRQAQEWWSTNKERACFYARKARSTPKGRLVSIIRNAIYRRIRSAGKNGRSTFDLLGYSVEELMAHLERQFSPGMSWANYGRWHIDHDTPVARFNFDSAEHPEFKACWALTNLKPLWARDNLSKGARGLA